MLWILAHGFAYLTSFFFQVLDFDVLKGFDFYFDLFWMAWSWKPAVNREIEIIAGFHMTSLNFKLQNYWSSRDFTFMMYKNS